MSNNRPTSLVDIHILLMSRNNVLLQLRQNTGFEDGSFHFPAGHLEGGENALRTAVREAKEELGVVIHEDQLKLVFTLHQYSEGSRIGLFFQVNHWRGTPKIAEPDKCADLRWFSPHQPPERLVPYARFVMESLRSGRQFGVFGWPARAGRTIAA